jgi:hypothetical protein
MVPQTLKRDSLVLPGAAVTPERTSGPALRKLGHFTLYHEALPRALARIALTSQDYRHMDAWQVPLVMAWRWHWCTVGWREAAENCV